MYMCMCVYTYIHICTYICKLVLTKLILGGRQQEEAVGAYEVHAQCCILHEFITLTGLSGDFCPGSSEKQQSCCKPPHSNALLMCKSPTRPCSKTLNLSNYPAAIVWLIRGKSLHLAVLAPSRQLDTRPGNDRKDDSVIMLSAGEQHMKRQPDYRMG